MKAWIRAATACLCFVAIASAATLAHAADYPSKPITIIVPASPGGVTDMLARILAKHFIADWGAEVVVENKPGANNQVAAEYVAHQPGDGSTLFIGPETTFIVNPALYEHLALRSGERFHADRRPCADQSRADHQFVGAR